MADIYAGVDLGGTSVKCALGTADGEMVAETKIATTAHEGAETVLERIGEAIEDLVNETGSRPVSLGMGVPGLVDIQEGVTRFLPNLAGHWKDVPAGPILSDALGCPVQLLNDVRTATLGELTFGHGRGVNTMAFFALGTGVGGGIVVDGKLRLGPLGAAGELGHMTILPDGPPCGCGSRGCVETLVGAPAIVAEGIRLMRIGLAPRLRELVEGDITRITPREMAEAAHSGDEDVKEAIVRAAGYLGLAVANTITVLHPELVVLGGGVANMGDLIFDRVREVVQEDVRMFPADEVRIESSLLEEKAGVMGALALASRGIDAAGKSD
ncbi:MAG: ROK family protein [Planctomycetota bacterium]|nr:MAG: ROK family protein [Planctomycetota bacterium]REJ86849.1 MAG: ROK family protein [Planctomycetota bacterium]REK22788.1 MAG: ROK family protein [Planctomycetota bacterium]REK33792.1 MAG: ROK family protein [Planctomycetota bacterium]